MKIVIAPDKFKNSLTGLSFCKAVKKGISNVLKNIDFVFLPLADGGDGTVEIMQFYLKGKKITTKVNNPFFKKINASYLYANNQKIAFIEMAEASGVKLLKKEELDCKNATTYGTGEMILDAISKGAKKIILGIGGSATNDCGIGMATSLGYQFLDKNKKEIKPIGVNLSKITYINTDKVNPKLKDVVFNIACDVDNPLYGKNGAAMRYAKQKGATSEEIIMLDKGLKDFSKLVENTFDIKTDSIIGAGAAGGMGFASKVFLNGSLNSGISLIQETANFNNQIKNADWIITGEGKLDNQTLSGKTINGVLKKAKNKKIAAFCGAIELDKNTIKKLGIDYSDSVINHSIDIDDAMTNSYKYVEKMAENFAKYIEN